MRLMDGVNANPPPPPPRRSQTSHSDRNAGVPHAPAGSRNTRDACVTRHSHIVWHPPPYLRTHRHNMAIHRLLTLLLCLGVTSSCAAQPASRPATEEAQQAARQEVSLFDPDVHLRTSDVRIGMKGHGLSVFKGSAIERFEVEVLAILRNSEQIGTEVVLIRASGAGLEHTGPIAGMSGSPVYLHCDDGKERLLGAFAFGWPGLKDPIAGVQPIEAMLQLDATPRAVEPAARAVDLESATWNLLSS